MSIKRDADGHSASYTTPMPPSPNKRRIIYYPELARETACANESNVMHSKGPDPFVWRARLPAIFSHLLNPSLAIDIR